MRWSFQLPIDLVSANSGCSNKGAAFASRRKYKAVRDSAYIHVCNFRERFQIDRAAGPRRITITRVCGPRQRCWDEDNLVAACKPVVDAIVRAGLLLDDDRKSVERDYRPDDTGQRDIGPAVEVIIENLY